MLKWRSLVRRCRRNMRFLIIFSCILLISNSMFSRAIWSFSREFSSEFFKDFKLQSSCGLVQFRSSLKNSLVHVFFQIALETILLPILTCT